MSYRLLYYLLLFNSIQLVNVNLLRANLKMSHRAKMPTTGSLMVKVLVMSWLLHCVI